MKRHAKASSVGSTPGRTNQPALATRGPFSEADKGIGAFRAGGCLALAFLIALLTPMALAVTPVNAAIAHHLKTTFGAFANPSGIGVNDANGNVFLADGSPENVVDISGPVGQAPAGVASPFKIEGFAFGNEPSGVAIDNSATSPSKGALYVDDVQNNSVKKFTLNGSEGYELQEKLVATPGFSEPLGLAVDSKGNVFVGDYGSSSVIEFNPAGTEIARVNVAASVGNPSAVAVDSVGNLYVEAYGSAAGGSRVVRYAANGSGEIEPGTVASTVIAAGATGIAVAKGTNAFYVALGDHVSQYSSAGVIESEFGVGTLIASQRVAIGPAGDVYVVDRGAHKVAVFGPAVVVPSAETEAATDVTKTSATLHGTVSADGGPPASCVFQYVEIHAHSYEGATSVPCSPEGPYEGAGAVAVKADIASLPEAAYRFRLVASNENGDNNGKTLFFNTLQAPPGLPDSRAYELVSPPQKLGEVIPPEASGSLGSSCGVECLPGGFANSMAMQSTPDGEAVVFEGQPFSGNLAPGSDGYLATRGPGGWGAQNLSTPFFNASYYQAFSPDLSRGVLKQISGSPLSLDAPSREGKGFGNLYLRSEDGSLQALITAEPPHRDPGTPEGNGFGVSYSGANAGTASSTPLSHLIFEANDALTAKVEGIAPDAPTIEPEERNLYEWSAGQLHLVNVLPGNAAAASGAAIGSGRLLADDPSVGADVDHAISADGSRIFWSDESGQVYVRVDGKETVEIEDHTGRFLTASADGSKVLLNDGCLYDLGEEECEEDLTKGQGGLEGILGAADDLSRIYFVDTEALTAPSEENANHKHAEAGKPNLYAWHEGDTAFIGALDQNDNSVGLRFGVWKAARQHRTAQVSTDGRYLAFMSRAPLTGYDSTVQGGGECRGSTNASPDCAEVFEYDAASAHLGCPSCNPTDQPPLGPSNLSLISPGGRYLNPFRQPGNLSTDGQGRLFFESQDTLSSRDKNGHIQDVYEWEPNGVGNCNRAVGCVSLISSGLSPNDSMFFDSTPSGDDAFFITREQLLLRDKDDFLDLYDARVGGGISENTPPPCLGEACKGQGTSATEQPSPGSASFVGPGNEKPKKQHKHKKKHRKHAHKHKSQKRAAKHNSGGSK